MQDCPPVEIQHVFSVEIDEKKRDLILAEHSPQHVFADVEVFKTMQGYCCTCKTEHKLDASNYAHDILVAGTSCKDLRRLNNQRKNEVGCFDRDELDQQTGTSGPTYLYGFRKATRLKWC